MTWRTIHTCALCQSSNLVRVISLGLLPLVNAYRDSVRQEPETLYPHEMLRCFNCELVQLGIAVSQLEVFGKSYPYTSSTTKALRDNFADLARDVVDRLKPHDLVIDIGGNDGNLLSNFTDCRTLNVTPEDIGKLGVARGIPHLQAYWDHSSAEDVVAEHGRAAVICATNVFAHVPDPNGFIASAVSALKDDGVIVLEVQYLIDLLDRVQYDHLYVEHRYFWTLTTLSRLLDLHGLEVFRAKRIKTHGGSIRVMVRRKTGAPEADDVAAMRAAEADYFSPSRNGDPYKRFATGVRESRRDLWGMLGPIAQVVGIGAPSRAGTLVNFCGLDEHVMPYICETPGSHKIGKFFPGTRIPVVDEERLYREQPSHALILAWHVADELMASLRAKGYRGRFLVPLPEPMVFE